AKPQRELANVGRMARVEGFLRLRGKKGPCLVDPSAADQDDRSHDARGASCGRVVHHVRPLAQDGVAALESREEREAVLFESLAHFPHQFVRGRQEPPQIGTLWANFAQMRTNAAMGILRHLPRLTPAVVFRDLRNVDTEVHGEPSVAIFPKARDVGRSRRIEAAHLEPNHLRETIGRPPVERPPTATEASLFQEGTNAPLDDVHGSDVSGFRSHAGVPTYRRSAAGPAILATGARKPPVGPEGELPGASSPRSRGRPRLPGASQTPLTGRGELPGAFGDPDPVPRSNPKSPPRPRSADRNSPKSPNATEIGR